MQLRSTCTQDEMWTLLERVELFGKEVDELRTSYNVLGRIVNDVELIKNGLKLTTDGLELLENVVQTR